MFRYIVRSTDVRLVSVLGNVSILAGYNVRTSVSHFSDNGSVNYCAIGECTRGNLSILAGHKVQTNVNLFRYLVRSTAAQSVNILGNVSIFAGRKVRKSVSYVPVSRSVHCCTVGECTR